jgi:acetyltransferase EpsM
MNKQPIAIIGSGGHSKVIQDCIIAQGKYTIKAILDDRIDHPTEKDGRIFAPVDYIKTLVENTVGINVIIAIGNNKIRKSISERIRHISNLTYATIIHPSAVISPSVNISEGSVIMPNAIVNADSNIGKHAILNSGCIVEHDSTIGDFVHISPKTTLTGAAFVGEGSHIGAGAVTIPSIKIGMWAIVGAGAAVVKDVSDEATVAGVPARRIR